MCKQKLNKFMGAVGGPLRTVEDCSKLKQLAPASSRDKACNETISKSCKTILIAIHPTCYLLAINNCFAFMLNSPADNLPIQ